MNERIEAIEAHIRRALMLSKSAEQRELLEQALKQLDELVFEMNDQYSAGFEDGFRDGYNSRYTLVDTLPLDEEDLDSAPILTPEALPEQPVATTLAEQIASAIHVWLQLYAQADVLSQADMWMKLPDDEKRLVLRYLATVL